MRGPAANHLAPEVDELVDQVDERQRPRPPADDRHRIDPERGLQWRVLVEIVQHHLGHFAAPQLDHDAHPRAVGLVPQVRDTLDRLVLNEVGDLLQQARLVHLVGDLGDDDRVLVLLAPRRFHVGAGADDHRAAAGQVAVTDAGPADDDAAGRKVGAGNMLQKPLLPFFARGVRMLGRPDESVDHFPQVVRRYLGRHPDRDSVGAVHEQIREGRRQNRRFLGRLVVIRDEVDRVTVDVRHQVVGERLEPGLGVAHRGRRVAVHGAEVPLLVHQGVAHVEGLCEADQRVVNAAVAMGMEVPHHLADDLGALAVGAVRRQPHRPHAVDDAAVGRLQAVPHVGEGAADDYAHGVIHVRPAHFVLDGDRDVRGRRLFEVGHRTARRPS